MDIGNVSLTAELTWDNLNTGFLDSADATVVTTLVGSSDIPLPVEFSSLTASVKKNVVNLKQQTKSELNNFGFNVERRINEGEQNSIGFVEGYRNSNSPKEYNYSGKDLFAGGSEFQYRLKQLDTDGIYKYSNEIIVEIIPNKFALYQNYQNPFNPNTIIKFAASKESNVDLSIYNVLCELVSTLVKKK